MFLIIFLGFFFVWFFGLACLDVCGGFISIQYLMEHSFVRYGVRLDIWVSVCVGCREQPQKNKLIKGLYKYIYIMSGQNMHARRWQRATQSH